MMRPIREGELTKTVYSHIHDHQYEDAIRILNEYNTGRNSSSRANFSLLAYCYYHIQDFASAASYYQQLSHLCPENEEYKAYWIQCLVKAGHYEEASNQLLSMNSGAGGAVSATSSDLQERLHHLQATIHYERDELQLARNVLTAPNATEDPEQKTIFEASLLWKEQRYAEALKLYQEALQTLGFVACVVYNIALCYYSLKQYGPALKQLADIIEKGVREHPELAVGGSDYSGNNLPTRSVGNTSVLRESALVEAFNLKAAIEYQMENKEAARDALQDMPPREESELDQVTLHNLALIQNMEDKPSEGFRKLNFLLQQQPSPPETFVNLLLLYCKYNYFDLAADILAENADLTYKYLNPQEFEFLDALILAQSAPEDAFKRFEELSGKHVDALRRGTKNIQDARRQRDQPLVKKHLAEFDDSLSKYIPVLMGQAKIYWEKEKYGEVEKLFRQSAEYCSDDESWKLNVAHVFFMQEKFKDSIRYYEPFVRKHQDNLLSVTAIILANLCVSYVMTSANEEAEELMRLVEKEEEQKDPTKPVYHLCIINLVIGTLYCAKGNFEFGISRIIKSLDPLERKLGVDTWYYAKRCFLALGETLSKNMILLKDEAFEDILTFFDSVASAGKHINASLNHLDRDDKTKTVAREARLLKKFFLKISQDF
ncbi:unnamed protein product [Amoebophrya sp. A120]|nr:unnamed protein product [Amoebophrya sp. A120]|eukprot:GSA120T00005987001.1